MRYKILINAFAVCPGKGSEPGMGWNWISSIAKYCDVVVITELEFKGEIEAALLQHPYAGHMKFHFVDVGGDDVRRMCWNQGDWRFYAYYRRWQKHALDLAETLVELESIDLIHQLNMIGYREPGYLWKISSVPFVWGPVGGFGNFPNSFVRYFPFTKRLQQYLKSAINSVQYRMPRVQKAIKSSKAIFAANGNSLGILRKFSSNALLINDAGSYLPMERNAKTDDGSLRLCWVGKNMPRKALWLALDTMQRLLDYPVFLHVVGVSGDELGERDIPSQNIIFHGTVSHDQAMKLIGDSDAMLFTSLHEGTPHAVLESLRCSVPVLCHDAWGQGDVIDETCGIKVPLVSPEVSLKGFEEAILRLLHDKVYLETLSNGCKKRSIDLTWDVGAKKMVDVYSKVISREE